MVILLDDTVVQSDRIDVEKGSSLWRGEGWFETLALHQNEIFNLPNHLIRLRNSLPEDARENLPLESLPQHLDELRSKASDSSGRLKLVVWEETTGYRLAGWFESYEPPSRQQYREGVNLRVQRCSHPPRWPLTDQKRTSYASVLAERDRTDGWDVLYCDPDGQVWETGVANLLWLDGGRLIHPPLNGDLLPGTVLEANLSRAGSIGLTVTARTEHWRELGDFCWLTNSLIGMLPVNRIEGTEYFVSDVPDRWLKLRETLISDRIFPRWFDGTLFPGSGS